MKKIILLSAILLIFTMLLLGCGGTATTTSPASQTPTVTGTPTQAGATSPIASTQSPTKTTSTPTATKKYGGVLRILDMRLPTGSLGWPAKINNQDAFFLQPAIETLIRIDAKGVPQPQLATSWEVAPDRSSITLKLRQGVKFHDGTDFNAQAAKFNLDSVREAKLPGATNWTSVEILDDYTVKINISKWENLIFGNLGGRTGMMVSPTAIQKNGVDWAATNIAGTGPFKLTNFERDTVLEFKKNENYWQTGKPYLDGIKWICIPDTMTQISTFKVGDADLIQPWNGQVLSQLKGLPGTVFQYRHSGVFVLYPDAANADSPFSKKLVREAIEYAIDKDAMMKIAGFGIFESAYQLPCPATIGYIPDLPIRKYDPVKAKLLLGQAGYPDGFQCTLSITIPAPDIKDAQVAIQGFLSKIGITCNLEYADPAKYSDYMTKGWHNTLIYSPANTEGNFTSSVQTYFTIPNYYVSLKGPANLMDLYNEAISTPNVEPEKVQKLARAIFDDASLIPVSYMGTGQVYYDYLHDAGFLEYSSQMNFSPENAWMSK